MTRLERKLAPYLLNHQNRKNIATHWVGIPLVVFSLFILGSWLPLQGPFTAATALLVGSLLYYFWVSGIACLLIAVWTIPLYLAAVRISDLPHHQTVLWFSATFTLGWAFQILGHWFEGKRPAFVDNLFQVFSGPLLLGYELGLALRLFKTSSGARRI